MRQASRRDAAGFPRRLQGAHGSWLLLAAVTVLLAAPHRVHAQDTPAPPAHDAAPAAAPSADQPDVRAQTPAAPAAAARPAATRNGATPTLDRRMQAMTRELQLDAQQQAQIRQILQSQREAVHKIWVDPTLLPAERAAVTQAQTEHTGDAIRAVLNDEQKKLYNRSRTDQSLPPGDKRGVEQWMDAAHSPRPGSP
jgi:hypothetical protein